MTQSKRSPKAQPPTTSSNVLFGLAVLVVIAVGAFLFLRPSAPDASAVTSSASAGALLAQTAATPEADVTAVRVTTAPPKPGHPADVPLPELPLGNFSPARPDEQVREAYLFAAEHPEVLQYVPCFCGCETRGHVGNDNCFVAGRDAEGHVTAWEPHGVSCAVCLDVATDARRMYASGATVTQIRTAVEDKYRPLTASMTPTPMPEHASGTE